MALERELVLVADDDADNRASLARLLERGGYRSVGVADGRDALRAAVDERPDLILLDVDLPGLDGLDVCRRLRADPQTVALPIILVTGQTASRDVVAGLDAGADDFVRKPYDEAELMARVRNVLRLARVTAEMVGAHGVIAALANAVEAKDATTEMHCQRLAGLAHQLGMHAGLEPAALKGLVFGALLHDIGTIGVSEAILTKPGPLSRQEWAEVRLHPLIGERICEPLATASEFAAIVRHHHERWDGDGYPDGQRRSPSEPGSSASSTPSTRSSTTGRTGRREPSTRRSRSSTHRLAGSSIRTWSTCSCRSSSAMARSCGRRPSGCSRRFGPQSDGSPMDCGAVARKLAD